MDGTTKKGMPMGMVVGIMVLAAVIFGGGAYAYVNNKAEKEKKDLNAQITELQRQVSSGSTAALLAVCQSANTGLTCAVSKVDGNYATGTASSTGGGAQWYATKTSGSWALISGNSGSYGFQDDPSCSKTSDFPKSIVPTCANN